LFQIGIAFCPIKVTKYESIKNTIMSILQSLLSMVGVIPSILILVASIIILSRTKHAGAILMVIGQSINFLMSIYYAILWPLLIRSDLVTSQISVISSITQLISILGSITLGAGLLILGLGYLKK
jgi:hypothetical protein